MSGHHSRYRDNYQNQVYHDGCQEIARPDGDIRQVTSDKSCHNRGQVIRDKIIGAGVKW